MSKLAIYGNKRTKVAHRRGKRGDPCRAHSLKPGNVENFKTFASAWTAGYRACKRCLP